MTEFENDRYFLQNLFDYGIPPRWGTIRSPGSAWPFWKKQNMSPTGLRSISSNHGESTNAATRCCQRAQMSRSECLPAARYAKLDDIKSRLVAWAEIESTTLHVIEIIWVKMERRKPLEGRWMLVCEESWQPWLDHWKVFLSLGHSWTHAGS